jgi:type VI secretion system protein ImpG
MTQPIEVFFERELQFLEETAQAFADRYPANASRLVLESGRSIDPHLDRLIEGFAVLAGRVRHKLESDFSELTESLLQILYPHLRLIIPSMAIAQVVVPPGSRNLRDGWRLEKDTVVRSTAFREQAEMFQYSLGYPVAVWPIELKGVAWETSPFDLGMRPPHGTVAVLRMQFACQDGLRWDDLNLEKLRLHLSGDRQFIAGLYEIMFNRCLGVAFQAVDMGAEAGTSRTPITMQPDECLAQVGLDLDEGLLPFPPESFVGYRLLMELLSFPQKFLFADLGGWKKLRGRGFGSQIEVLFFFSHSQDNLEKGLSAENFLLGCVPVVNVFRKSTEPIGYTHKRWEHRVVPTRRPEGDMEVYRIESVRSVDSETGAFRDYQPFFASSFGPALARPAYFHATRRPSLLEEVPGSEVYVTLVDPEFHPSKPTNTVLDIQAWCTNRDLPFKLQQAGDRLLLSSDPFGDQGWLQLLHKPTAPLRPFLREGTYWRLLGQNCLNHVSLVQGAEGLQALRELLSLCDFAGPTTQQLAAVNQQIIDGIKSIRSRPIMERVRSSASRFSMCRGMELLVEFDEEKYMGTGVFLMASVLERFFALYTGVNSFTKLIARTTQAEGNVRTWPPRAGAHRLP